MEILKLSSQKITLGCLFLLFLSGCSLFNPYIDRRRNPGVADINKLYTGPSKPDKPVICYNGWFTDDTTLQQMADAECIKHGTGTKAEFIQKTHFDGKLLLPSHAHYQCIKSTPNKE